MNESLNAFLALNQAIELIQTNDNESSELKKSVTDLSQSVQVCTEEMRNFAVKLGELIKNCYQDLDQAEEVWNSKARILSIPKDEIWEQVAQLTNVNVRIRNLREKCQTEVIQTVKQSWANRIEKLKQQWFLEKNTGKYKQEIGLLDKDTLIKGLEREILDQNNQINLAIKYNLELLDKELCSLDINSIKSHIQCCEPQEENKLLNQINRYSYQKNFLFYIKGNTGNSLFNLIKASWDAFLKDSFLVIKREQLNDFFNTVRIFIDNILFGRFNECFDLAIEVTNFYLIFYNDLLERHNRYEQEIPVQWQAEKNSLEQLRSQVDKVGKEIQMILNSV